MWAGCRGALGRQGLLDTMTGRPTIARLSMPLRLYERPQGAIRFRLTLPPLVAACLEAHNSIVYVRGAAMGERPLPDALLLAFAKACQQLNCDQCYREEVASA